MNIIIILSALGKTADAQLAHPPGAVPTYARAVPSFEMPKQCNVSPGPSGGKAQPRDGGAARAPGAGEGKAEAGKRQRL